MSDDIHHRIAALARGQHGVVSRAQLLELGLTSPAVRHRIRTGRLRRLHRGVYLLGPIMPEWAKEMAAVLACASGALLSHRSAISIWDLGAARESGPVDVALPGGHGARRPGIRTRRIAPLDPGERAERRGIPVTSPGRSLVDFAGVAGRRELEQAVARAEREGLVGPDDLARLVDRYRGRPGVPALRDILAQAAGPALTRSEAEERFLALAREAWLPAPETNVRIAGCEVDFFWRAHRIAVEVDGYRYHGFRRRFETDRRRITRLAAHGVLVIPLTWSQIVHDGPRTALQLKRALLFR